MSFACDSSVTRVDDDRFDALLAADWDIAGNANGGYLLAIAARAMAIDSRRPDPITITGHYLRPGRPGPATVTCRTVRRGRRLATARATLAQGDAAVLEVLGTFGDLASAAPGPRLVLDAPPDLPAPERCARIAEGKGTGFPPPFMGRVDVRLHPEDAGVFDGKTLGEPRIRGWFRLPDNEPIDTIALLLAADALPPTIINAGLPVAWTPTVEFTVHVRAQPAPGWLRAQFTTRVVSDGFLEEDGVLFDETDRVVAQSRQLALVPAAPANAD